jgi:acyl-CoA thioesterase-1
MNIFIRSQLQFRSLSRRRFVSLTASVLSALALPTFASDSSQSIVVLGDSLSAGYGLNADEGWTHYLSQQLAREGYDYKVINASVSGETSSGGQQRLSGLLKREHPAIVIIELGANDGLRGLDPDQLTQHLNAMVKQCKELPAKVLLIGIELPANYGTEYRKAVLDSYRVVAKSNAVPLMPNLLEKVPLTLDHFQADRLHPVAAMQPIIEADVFSYLKPLLHKRSVP